MACRGVDKWFYHYTHKTISIQEYVIRRLSGRAIHDRRPKFTLRGLELTVGSGESIAFIGDNGSGKSTALRLIAGIYAPSKGTIATHGRLAAVIELGVGFNQALTGIENVQLYASVMGLGRRETAERLPRIVEFSELEVFIDEPLKYYSSGMQARLAFAVAIHGDAEILLLDEVLSVGDQRFRQRCLARIEAFARQSGTLIFASHDLDLVASLCARAVWFDAGRIVSVGPSDEVVEQYRSRAGVEP